MSVQTFVLQTPYCTVTNTGTRPFSVWFNGQYLGTGGSQAQPSASHDAVSKPSSTARWGLDRRPRSPPASLPHRRPLDAEPGDQGRLGAIARSSLGGLASSDASYERSPTPGSKRIKTDHHDLGYYHAASQEPVVDHYPRSSFGLSELQVLSDAQTYTPEEIEAHNRHCTAEALKRFQSYGGLRPKPATGDDLADEMTHYKQPLYIDVNDMLTDLNCEQVRSLINKLLDGDIMKRAEFCEVVNCSGTALRNFLKKTGLQDGEKSEVYRNAWSWFKQREVAGLVMPDVPKRSPKPATASTPKPHGVATASGSASRRVSAPRPASIPDISNVYLEGQETDEVRIYDDCDEVRRKVEEHLQTPGLTQAQFCRDLYQQFNNPKVSGIQTVQLQIFRNKDGPKAGNTSSVFYAAYVYFEKLRIARGEPKSELRRQMEDVYNEQPGFDIRFSAYDKGATG